MVQAEIDIRATKMTSETKTCTSCHAEKLISEFGTYRRKLASGSFRVAAKIYCRECEKLNAKEQRTKHPEKTKEYNARPEVKARKKQWADDNDVAAKRKNYHHQRYLDNIEAFKAYSKTPKA